MGVRKCLYSTRCEDDRCSNRGELVQQKVCWVQTGRVAPTVSASSLQNVQHVDCSLGLRVNNSHKFQIQYNGSSLSYDECNALVPETIAAAAAASAAGVMHCLFDLQPSLVLLLLVLWRRSAPGHRSMALQQSIFSEIAKDSSSSNSNSTNGSSTDG